MGQKGEGLWGGEGNPRQKGVPAGRLQAVFSGIEVSECLVHAFLHSPQAKSADKGWALIWGI